MNQENSPVVSIAIPMLNEQDYIGKCLDGFAAQTWPKSHLDIMVIDGGSSDDSRALVAERAKRETWLRLLDNPHGSAAAAFNLGVAQAKGELVGLFSAHGVPDPTYVESSVSSMAKSGAAGVGGRYVHLGMDSLSNSIGLAMMSPFGMASPHRYASVASEVDTISHPIYVKKALEIVGPFNESLKRNSDYEMNYRLRKAGYRLWFDPSVSSVYRPRGSLHKLTRQFWDYGQGKFMVVEANPDSLRPRHLAAPMLAGMFALLPVLALSRRGRRLVKITLLAYSIGIAAATAKAHPKQHKASILQTAAAFPAMHLAWGGGFLFGALRSGYARIVRRPPAMRSSER